ncbi:MAG: BrnT family toxin [Anaerolineales bacterium]|nr:BrnT family toxin [Anaerolineales bacterium]
MKINRLIWLDQYLIKIEVKHGVYQNEVREILFSHPRIRRVGKGKSNQGEHLYVAYGQTQTGRYLTVFFIHKPGNEALIISARDMDEKERKQYGRK